MIFPLVKICKINKERNDIRHDLQDYQDYSFSFNTILLTRSIHKLKGKIPPPFYGDPLAKGVEQRKKKTASYIILPLIRGDANRQWGFLTKLL